MFDDQRLRFAVFISSCYRLYQSYEFNHMSYQGYRFLHHCIMTLPFVEHLVSFSSVGTPSIRRQSLLPYYFSSFTFSWFLWFCVNKNFLFVPVTWLYLHLSVLFCHFVCSVGFFCSLTIHPFGLIFRTYIFNLLEFRLQISC